MKTTFQNRRVPTVYRRLRDAWHHIFRTEALVERKNRRGKVIGWVRCGMRRLDGSPSLAAFLAHNGHVGTRRGNGRAARH